MHALVYLVVFLFLLAVKIAAIIGLIWLIVTCVKAFW
jgi:hypothetical protein